jgi:hypothetical protein
MQETVCGKSLRAAQTRHGAIVSLVGSRPIRISMRSPNIEIAADTQQAGSCGWMFGSTSTGRVDS